MTLLEKVKKCFNKGEKAASKVANKAKSAADTNKDGKVNLADAKAAKNKAVKAVHKKTAPKKNSKK